MPTFTSAPLETLLQPRARDSLKIPLSSGAPEHPNQRHLYISPEPTSHSNGPQVVCDDEVPVSPSANEGGGFNFNEEVGEYFGNENMDANDDDGFMDKRSELISLGSEVGADYFLFGKQTSSVSAQGEFFDANDDFSSDGSISKTSSYGSRVESELNAIRLSIFEEIERRKSAEETLIVMRTQWEKIGNLMSQAGLTFPACPAAIDNMQFENNSIDQFLQEIVVTRFVAEAVGRGVGHAEAEEIAAAIIELKEQEIVRLRDRVQYYETVNHELTQRKLLEVSRRQHLKKNRSRWRWIWSFAGLSIAIGASFVAYAYIPHASKYLSSLETHDGDLADASCVGTSDTT